MRVNERLTWETVKEDSEGPTKVQILLQTAPCGQETEGTKEREKCRQKFSVTCLTQIYFQVIFNLENFRIEKKNFNLPSYDIRSLNCLVSQYREICESFTFQEFGLASTISPLFPDK